MSKKAILDRHCSGGRSWNEVVFGDSGTYRAGSYVLNLILFSMKKYVLFSIILLLLGNASKKKKQQDKKTATSTWPTTKHITHFIYI